MHPNNRGLPFFFLIYLAIGAWACEQMVEPPCIDPLNPDCLNYDPCLGLSSANADFVMIDSFWNFHCNDIPGRAYYLSDNDTCISSKRIFLRATHDHDNYKWIIGGDSSYLQVRCIAFDVQENFPSDTISIQLIVSNQIPDICDIQISDTLTRTLNRIHSDLFGKSWSLVIGSFLGADTDMPEDTFTIIVPPIFPTLQGIDNFPRGCTGQYHNVGTYRHGLILHTFSTDCNSFCGIGLIQSDRKTLVIDYSVIEEGHKQIKRWIGTKVE